MGTNLTMTYPLKGVLYKPQGEEFGHRYISLEENLLERSSDLCLDQSMCVHNVFLIGMQQLEIANICVRLVRMTFH